MFKLLRYFSISSALAIGLMTLMVGLLYTSYENSRLLHRAEVQNTQDAARIMDAIQARHGAFLATAGQFRGDDLKLRWEVTDMDLMVRQLVLRHPIIEVEIMDFSGRTVYGSRLEKVGTELSATAWARAGRTSLPTQSKMITIKRFVGLTGFLSSAEAVKTATIIKGPTPASTYLVAISRDISTNKARIDHDIAIVTLFTVALCSILYFVLFLIVARADRIIAAQYNQISTFNARLETEVSDRTRSISDRHEAITELMKSPAIRSGTAKEAADEILRVTAKVLDVDRVSIGLLTEDRDQCEILDHIDLRSDQRYSGSAPKEMLIQNEIGSDMIPSIQAIPDVDTDGSLPSSLLRHAHRIGIRAILNVPITINGQFGGALAIRDCRAPRNWSPDDRMFATSLANLVALVIEREEGNRARERVAQDARRLIDSQMALSALLESEAFRSGSVNTAFGSLTETLVNVLDLDLATVWLFSDDRTAFHNAETYLRVKDSHTTSTLFLSVNIAQKLVGRILSNEVFAVEDMRTDPAIVEIAQFYKSAVWSKSSIWAPIVHNGRVVGALSAGTIGSHSAWTAHERLFVAAVATMVSIILERAERERVELDLRAANEAAEQASQAKSLFLANMSHEIRTPMNGVFGMADILAQSDLDVRQRRQVATIQQSARTLLKIINDVLDLSRIEAGKFELDYQPLDIRRAIESAVELFQDQFRQKGIDLTVFLAADVPHLVMSDETRLKQIAMNLIGNALKFTERGQVAIRVIAQHQDADNASIHFSISDTGIGIEPSVAETLFQPFAQADSSITRRFGGTGLGLSISRYLVELMGGKIEIDTAVGRGTTVHFVIPMRTIAAEPAARARFARDVDLRHVIVVDDREANREILASYLGSAGVDVATARNGAEAYALIQERHTQGRAFDAAVIDVIMPEENGIDLVRRLRASPHGMTLPIILATSAAHLDDARVAREAGVVTFLTKPVRREELLDAIEQAMRPGSQVIAPAAQRDDKAQFPLHVLVAEDNPVNEEVLREYLTMYGVTLEVARNGREAVDALERGHFDLVFMDCQMPEMDGLTATRAIRAYEARCQLPRVPIIAVTANAFEEDRAACVDAGMDGYLSKPFVDQDLLRVLEAHAKQQDLAAPSEPQPVVATVMPEASAAPALPHAMDRHLPPSLDAGLVSALRAKHPRLLEKLISTYMQHAPKVVDDAVAAIDNENVSALLLAAHSLKSSSTNVGATAVAEISRALEAFAKAKSIDDAKRLKGELQTAFEAAKQLLSTELVSLTGKAPKSAGSTRSQV